MSRRFTREQLYELVWSEPMQHVAKRLGISDVGLAKICRRAQVPVPERGYWAKLQAGKSVLQARLPARGLGMSGMVDVGAISSVNDSGQIEEIAEAPVPPSFPEPTAEVVERVRKLVNTVPLPKNLSAPHPLIGKLLQQDEVRRQKQTSSPYASPLDGPLFESRSEQRRLRILNSLFLTFERCGAPPYLRGSDARELSVLVGEIHVSYKLDYLRNGRSDSRRHSNPSPRTGERLRLEIERWWPEMPPLPSWEDNESIRLEDVLDDIAVQILVSGELLLRFGMQQLHEERVAERARRIEAARLRKEQEEHERQARIEEEHRQRVDQLLREVNLWRQAADIRAYVRALVEAKSDGDGAELGKIQQWVEWALQEADRLDPLSGLRAPARGCTEPRDSGLDV